MSWYETSLPNPQRLLPWQRSNNKGKLETQSRLSGLKIRSPNSNMQVFGGRVMVQLFWNYAKEHLIQAILQIEKYPYLNSNPVQWLLNPQDQAHAALDGNRPTMLGRHFLYPESRCFVIDRQDKRPELRALRSGWFLIMGFVWFTTELHLVNQAGRK